MLIILVIFLTFDIGIEDIKQFFIFIMSLIIIIRLKNIIFFFLTGSISVSRINYSIWLYIKIKTITFNRKSFYAPSFAYFTTYACYVHFFLHGTIMVKIYFLLHNFYCQKIFFLENEQFIISQYLFFSDSLFLFPRLTCIEKVQDEK